MGLLLGICMNANSQIKQDCYGNVGIGGNPPSTVVDLNSYSAKFNKIGINTTPGNYNLKTYGDLYFESGYVSLKYSCSYSPFEAEFFPVNNNLISLGLANSAFKNVYAYDYPSISDKRQKENIKSIENALDKVLKLNGVKYDIKKEFVYIDTINYSDKVKQKLEKDRKNKLGFLAQDVEKVIPEAVNIDDSTGVYTISYSRIIPVLVEAIKEQQGQIEALKEVLNYKQLKSTKSAESESIVTNAAWLGQNSPNPFNESTTIQYILSEEITEAYIILYNLSGVQIRNIPLPQTGTGAVTIAGGELQPGMYVYALLADGQLIDTKQMILTD